MNEDIFACAKDATPLDAEARAGLKLRYITQRHELNAAEAANILKAAIWAKSRKRNVTDIAFLNRLHAKMFGDVWAWAGTYSKEYRRRIGSDAHMIEMHLRELSSEVDYWAVHKTYTPDEIAVRFHHHLTQIHPYPNGNGRHARLAADVLALRLGRPVFGWGNNDLSHGGDVARRAYISALHAADAHDIVPLLKFARNKG